MIDSHRLLSPDVDVLWVARFDYEAGQSVSEHAHHFTQLISVRSGRGTWLLNGRRHTLSPGQLLYLQPRCQHGLVCQGPVSTYDVKFRISHGPLAAALAHIPPLSESAPPHLPFRMEALLAAAQHIHHRSERCQAELTALLTALLPTDRPLNPSLEAPQLLHADPIIQRLQEVVDQHLAEQLEGPDLARAVGCSYRYLAQRCKQAFACTPIQFLRQRRLSAARDLLRFSDHPVKAVAEACGFATIHHFTRVFSEAEGIGPATWRERNHGASPGLTVERDFSNELLVREPEANT